jgi:hypothetical protein
MAEQRDTPVMIVSVDEDLDGLRAQTDKLGSKVQWVTVSQEFFDQLIETIRNPEGRTRRSRPQRKEATDVP